MNDQSNRLGDDAEAAPVEAVKPQQSSSARVLHAFLAIIAGLGVVLVLALMWGAIIWSIVLLF
jgi:hypothetical protein